MFGNMPILPVISKTKVLMYAASGGLFGVGLGNGYLKDIFAGDSDLVFGMLCEEMGLVMGVIVVVAIAMLILFARNDATRSRSTFYSISACAAAGLLLFQTCLNVFGATDVLPLTGVTLPFISLGGSSYDGWFGDCWPLLKLPTNALVCSKEERQMKTTGWRSLILYIHRRRFFGRNYIPLSVVILYKAVLGQFVPPMRILPTMVS